ncbi:plastocyanin/azurin family copper-binding protein [Aequorivita marisscotiae]|uniref:Plastocyanin/azurin family copper-binding protein n=1 Tax=Aequorivita marisscotiae TaxID=3040348 RepID=A0ABY8KX32_9FLAO|nr:plastocyanin/azurin family copper-binding protein [Aequorivita sp. Ant34-E75]WGF92292.1 plastocyanin/azurin family copper-binding protein [Aequorivita sp. Ant34-E75]
MSLFYKSATLFSCFLVVLLGIFLVSTGFKPETPNTEAPVTHVVTIHQMKFDPEKLVVKKGDVVQWVNKDIVPHDVTEINKKWTSKILEKDAKYKKVITENLNYFCSLHVIMKGSVTVKNH